MGLSLVAVDHAPQRVGVRLGIMQETQTLCVLVYRSPQHLLCSALLALPHKVVAFILHDNGAAFLMLLVVGRQQV